MTRAVHGRGLQLLERERENQKKYSVVIVVCWFVVQMKESCVNACGMAQQRERAKSTRNTTNPSQTPREGFVIWRGGWVEGWID